MSDDTYQPSHQPTPAMGNTPPLLPVSGAMQICCPSCGATQFFGGRKTTGWGWFWIISATLNAIVSIPLMFVMVGWFTIFLSPIMGIFAHMCRRHVNTCARCKRDF